MSNQQSKRNNAPDRQSRRSSASDGQSPRRESPDRQSMGDVNHVHPHTGETFGAVYRRGPAMADGGQRDGPTPMKEVDHTPPYGDGAGAVWERGGEGADE